MIQTLYLIKCARNVFGFIPPEVNYAKISQPDGSLQLTIFTQQFVDDHAACRRHVERMLQAEHGNANLYVAARRYLGTDAFDFVAEHDTDGESRFPVEQIDGMHAGFNRGDLRSARP